jgi:hypothetical protein
VDHAGEFPLLGILKRMRKVLIVQAKPFHPIYMDVLDTAITQIMSRRAMGDTQESWATVVSTALCQSRLGFRPYPSSHRPST